eukprot:UN08761
MKVTLHDKNGKLYDRFLIKGCGVACEEKFGKHDIICPFCKYFIWRTVCLDDSFKKRKMMFDTANSLPYGDNWCCPQYD